MEWTPKVGDIVRLKTGKKPLKVTYVWPRSKQLNAQYLGHKNYEGRYNENWDRFVPYEDQTHQQQKEEAMQLYEIKNGENTTFGTKLAVNSEKKWVMEEKGTGSVLVVDPANVKKVMPYTIEIRFKGEGQNYAYLADKGVFKKGEFYLMKDVSDTWQIVQVGAVDTENEKATKEFKPIGRLNVELM